MRDRISADYLIIGAGAAGMAFADSLLTESDATMVIVDRNAKPGGHWNDAYPFVRLHQPSTSYGVGSTPLGSGRIDIEGHNAGFHELATGVEVLAHFDGVMRDRLLPSGRVRYFPMSEVTQDRVITSLLSGETQKVEAGRVVNATYSAMNVPSRTPPPFPVAAGVHMVPPNHIAHEAPSHDDVVVLGAGKTAMDTCVWLLDNGMDPDRITWVRPRDAWILNRARFQPGADHFTEMCRSIADQAEAVALAESVDDLFTRLEATGEVMRIDPSIDPEIYRCAILSSSELAQLRRITNVVRLGHVTGVEPDRVDLEHGQLPIGATTLLVHCCAVGIPPRPPVPVFDGDRITLQMVRTCQPTFSAALTAFVECAFDDDEEKNQICRPIVPPSVATDWLSMYRGELDNRARWLASPALSAWMAKSRLDIFTGPAMTHLASNAEAAAHIGRYLASVGPARTRLDQLLPQPVSAA